MRPRAIGKAVPSFATATERERIGADKVESAAFRDKDGAVRVVYREAVVRFEPQATQAQRKDEDESRARGDGLVPIDSALGRHPDSAFDLRIPKARQWVGYGINHLELLGSDVVYQQLERWLRKPL